MEHHEFGDSHGLPELASHLVFLQQQLVEKDKRIQILEKELQAVKEVNGGTLRNDVEVRSLEGKLKSAEEALKHSVARESFFMSQLEMMSKAVVKESAGVHGVAHSQQMAALEARLEAMDKETRQRERAFEEAFQAKVDSLSAKLQQSGMERAELVHSLQVTPAQLAALASQLAGVEGKLTKAEESVLQIEQKLSETNEDILALQEGAAKRTAGCLVDEIRPELEKLLSDHRIRQSRFETRKKKLATDLTALKASTESVLRRRSPSDELQLLRANTTSREEELLRKLQLFANAQAEALPLARRVANVSNYSKLVQRECFSFLNAFMTKEIRLERQQLLESLEEGAREEVLLISKRLKAYGLEQKDIQLQLECVRVEIDFLMEEEAESKSREGECHGGTELSKLEEELLHVTGRMQLLQESVEHCSAELRTAEAKRGNIQKHKDRNATLEEDVLKLFKGITSLNNVMKTFKL